MQAAARDLLALEDLADRDALTAAVLSAAASLGHNQSRGEHHRTDRPSRESLGVDLVLLDNMELPMLGAAVRMTRGRAITEASGRVTPETAPAIAETGVDQIAVGWITHSARVLGLDHA